MTYQLTSLQSAEADLRHAEMRLEDADGPWARSQERKLIDAIKAAIATHRTWKRQAAAAAARAAAAGLDADPFAGLAA